MILDRKRYLGPARYFFTIFPYYTLYFSYIRLRFERKIKLVHKYNYRIKSWKKHHSVRDTGSSGKVRLGSLPVDRESFSRRKILYYRQLFVLSVATFLNKSAIGTATSTATFGSLIDRQAPGFCFFFSSFSSPCFRKRDLSGVCGPQKVEKTRSRGGAPYKSLFSLSLSFSLSRRDKVGICPKTTGHRSCRNKFSLPSVYQWNYQYPKEYRQWSFATWPTSTLWGSLLSAVSYPESVPIWVTSTRRLGRTRFSQRYPIIYSCICRPFYRLPIESLYNRRRQTRTPCNGGESPRPTGRSESRALGWTPIQSDFQPRPRSGACKRISTVVCGGVASFYASFSSMWSNRPLWGCDWSPRTGRPPIEDRRTRFERNTILWLWRLCDCSSIWNFFFLLSLNYKTSM